MKVFKYSDFYIFSFWMKVFNYSDFYRCFQNGVFVSLVLFKELIVIRNLIIHKKKAIENEVTMLNILSILI